MCSSPRKPQRKPKPSAVDVSGSYVQPGVVELQLLERVAQRLVLVGVRRIEPGEHHRLHVAVARQRLGGAVVRRRRSCRRPARPAPAARSRRRSPTSPGPSSRLRDLAELVVADLVDFVHVVGMGAERDLHPLAHHAVDDADARDGARDSGRSTNRRSAPGAVPSRVPAGGGTRATIASSSSGMPMPSLADDREDLLPLGADQIHDLLLRAAPARRPADRSC